MTLPLTRLRLCGARCLYRLIRLFVRSDHQRITRAGITYDVDLSEGLDLALFALGSFQRHVTDTTYYELARDAVVFDVGANVGAMSLTFAQRAPQGTIYAFEPVESTYRKLIQNLALNPDIAPRIRPFRAFVSDYSTESGRIVAYASWKVDGSAPTQHVHPINGASICAEKTRVVTLDEFCRDHAIERVDFIKVDTDGHEFAVLQGARELIERHNPIVLFEIGDYLLKEHGLSFGHFLRFFEPFGYALINSKNGRRVTLDNYHREIPLKATTDLIALQACLS